jgi:signal transduction histidine kinase
VVDVPPVPIPPRLLSLAVHEFRTPVTVVAGYLRMLLKERAGPLTADQRKLIEEAEKSCGRLSALLTEMGDLGQLETGRQSLASNPLDLSDLLAQTVAAVEPRAGDANVVLQGDSVRLPIMGDGARLRRAFDAIVFALRREIIDGTDLHVVRAVRNRNGQRLAGIAIGPPAVAAALGTAAVDELAAFDEWRGGCGLSLPLARRIIEMHGGRAFALAGERQKAGGLVELPLSTE